ncbi:DUF6731 family protein [Verticiella sediminum]
MPPIDSLLGSLSTKSLRDREAVCGGTTVRLEEISRVTHPNFPAPHWRMTFCRARDSNWPGQGTPGVASSDLPLGHGSVLLEQSSALYFPHCQRLVMQYNHSGVRVTKVADFLTQQAVAAAGSTLGAATYNAVPVLDPSVITRYRKHSDVTRIDVLIDDLTKADLALFQGSSISGTLRESAEEGTERVELVFSVDARIPGNKVSRSLMRRLVPAMLRRNNGGDKLMISARAGPTGKLVDLNLLDAAKQKTISQTNIVVTQGRRYDTTSMCENLEGICLGWAW